MLSVTPVTAHAVLRRGQPCTSWLPIVVLITATYQVLPDKYDMVGTKLFHVPIKAHMMMKTVLLLGVALLAIALSVPASAAGKGDVLAGLDAACAPLPKGPGASRSLVDHGKAVEVFAATVSAYQDCLYQQLAKHRSSLTQSEQAAIAARMSRGSYSLTIARQTYANAVRTSRRPVQVAQLTVNEVSHFASH